MKSYIALIQLDLKLALRQKSVLFFNYMFPLIFFVVFAQALHGDRGNAMTQIVTMVIIIGVLGNGLFGAGMRAVQERESNVLRRYKVTPITPAPILIAATVVGWILFMPLVLFMFCVAHFGYGMPWPERLGSILLFATLGILAFRAIGMILAAVANSMQESQILVQLVYLPMLFLSGATFPTSMFPSWLLIVTQFLASHLPGFGARRNDAAPGEPGGECASGVGSPDHRVRGTFHFLQAFPLGKRRKDSQLRQALGGGGNVAVHRAWRMAGAQQAECGQDQDAEPPTRTR